MLLCSVIKLFLQSNLDPIVCFLNNKIHITLQQFHLTLLRKLIITLAAVDYAVFHSPSLIILNIFT
ncbi:unnamed protein product, partial [Schistosoma intercalatum]